MGLQCVQHSTHQSVVAELACQSYLRMIPQTPRSATRACHGRLEQTQAHEVESKCRAEGLAGMLEAAYPKGFYFCWRADAKAQGALWAPTRACGR